jgi:hypothetical protein
MGTFVAKHLLQTKSPQSLSDATKNESNTTTQQQASERSTLPQQPKSEQSSQQTMPTEIPFVQKEKTHQGEGEKVTPSSKISVSTKHSSVKTQNRFLSDIETLSLEEGSVIITFSSRLFFSEFFCLLESQNVSHLDTEPPVVSGVVHIKEQQTGIEQPEEGSMLVPVFFVTQS